MRYDHRELQEMAQVALKAKRQMDPRYSQLIMAMMLRTGLDPEEIERKLKELAR